MLTTTQAENIGHLATAYQALNQEAERIAAELQPLAVNDAAAQALRAAIMLASGGRQCIPVPPLPPINVRVHNVHSHKYVLVSNEVFSMDVHLDAGKAPAQSLRDSARRYRSLAGDTLERAQRLEQAAAMLESPP